MKTFRRLTMQSLVAASLAAGTLLAAMPAAAHGIWFAQRATQLALIYGVGADDLDAVRRMPLVKSVEGFDDSWAPVPASLRVAGIVPVVDTEGPVAAVAAMMDNGMWSKTADGRWIGKGRSQVPDAVLAERTMKFAVHLTKPLTGPIPAIASQTLQVVPVGAIPAEAGKPLALRVLFKGQPVAGAQVKADWVTDPDQAPLMSDARGEVTIPVRNQGLNVVTAIHVGPTDNPAEYQRIEYLATLSFVLPHAPE